MVQMREGHLHLAKVIDFNTITQNLYFLAKFIPFRKIHTLPQNSYFSAKLSYFIAKLILLRKIAYIICRKHPFTANFSHKISYFQPQILKASFKIQVDGSNVTGGAYTDITI